jgi:hypothetical protein
MLLFNLYTTPSNDLDDPGRISLVQRALTALAPGGEPVLIEPALRETSRDLHRVRDHVLGPRAGPCVRARGRPRPVLAASATGATKIGRAGVSWHPWPGPPKLRVRELP